MSTTSSHPSPLPISAKKLAANRANARHSTGPRTPEGKHKSSKNACTHRLYSPDLLLPGEDATLLRTFRRALLHDLRPRTSLEAAVADRVAGLHWRLRRVASAEHFLTTWAATDYADRTRRANEDEQVRRDQARDLLIESGLPADRVDDDTPPPPPGHPDHDPDEYADYLDNNRPLPDPYTPPAPGYHLAADLRLAHQSKHPTAAATRSTPFERLLNAESRLQSLLDRNMKELRHLQSDRRQRQDDPDDDDDESPVPHYLDDPWDDEDTDDASDLEPAPADADDDDDDDDDDADHAPAAPAPAQNEPTTPSSSLRALRVSVVTPTPGAPTPPDPRNEPTAILQSAQTLAAQAIHNRKRGT